MYDFRWHPSFSNRALPPAPDPALAPNVDLDALAVQRQAERNAAESKTNLLHEPDVLELVARVSSNMLGSFRATHPGRFMDHLEALPTANLHTLHADHHQWVILLKYRPYQEIAARALQELWDSTLREGGTKP